MNQQLSNKLNLSLLLGPPTKSFNNKFNKLRIHLWHKLPRSLLKLSTMSLLKHNKTNISNHNHPASLLFPQMSPKTRLPKFRFPKHNNRLATIKQDMLSKISIKISTNPLPNRQTLSSNASMLFQTQYFFKLMIKMLKQHLNNNKFHLNSICPSKIIIKSTNQCSSHSISSSNSSSRCPTTNYSRCLHSRLHTNNTDLLH